MIKTIYLLLGIGAASCLVSLILTPLVRELNRRLGIVDMPDARRINKTPIPRGGGIAIFFSVVLVYSAFLWLYGDSVMTPYRVSAFPKFLLFGSAMVALGYIDDRWSLPPRVKLLGQFLIAFGTWMYADVGFLNLFPNLPVWADCALTMFWIVGAVNAFNLIDGLDGLASGLAMIATIGMAGALVFTGSTGLTYFHAVLCGALLGFLRYNYNPASVFLGDSGSMFLGFTIAILPLHFNTTRSFFVAVGVPMLAMGVPIFDTSLAILRRSIRHLLAKRGRNGGANDKVMTADTDHLHHRILRDVGFNQRKAAWVIYGMAFLLVALALGDLAIASRRAGLWLAGLTLISIIVVRNFARIELYDAARLLGDMAHDRNFRARRKYQRLAVPFFVMMDIGVIVASYFTIAWIVGKDLNDVKLSLPFCVLTYMFSLLMFRTYVTIWPRAVISNYTRLFLASCFGSILFALSIYYAPQITLYKVRASFSLFALLPFLGFVSIRLVRPFLRDLLYAIDCRNLIARKDVSRVLVYGSGLRYAAFRRELVRSASANRRIIVGLLDDDIIQRGHYVGGIQVKGTINDAPEVITRMNVDAVVIACQMSDNWRNLVMEVLRPTGVKVTEFKFSEEELV